ncbi:MAG: hypothetical protein CMJ58_13480 [Planctomycetaceae bacterium]|nr:hypothetical protein [Planctomycetaceae bacterium]
MKLDAIPTGGRAAPQSPTPDRQVQGVFSALLEAAGRSGYASAQSGRDTPLADNSAQAAWFDWFAVERGGGRYASESTADAQQLRSGYGEILARAHAEGGYVAPFDFLRRLSQDELEIVQHVHRLAQPIDVGALNEEGALNLLLPPAAQVDLNHDGLTQAGAGMSLRFPDSNTPASVVDAWEEATAGLPPGERMMYELRMVLPTALANIHTDETGAFSHAVEPGDPEWINPLADPGYSYATATQQQLDGLDFALSLGSITRAQYDRQQGFWQGLQDALRERGAQ